LVDGAETVHARVLRKARFWGKQAGAAFKERQRDMLGRLLDGFEGKLTLSKWAKIEKCSPDTALRDISDLVERGILKKDAGGERSTSSSLIEQAQARRQSEFKALADREVVLLESVVTEAFEVYDEIAEPAAWPVRPLFTAKWQSRLGLAGHSSVEDR
jgi:hypothetical protein